MEHGNHYLTTHASHISIQYKTESNRCESLGLSILDMNLMLNTYSLQRTTIHYDES